MEALVLIYVQGMLYISSAPPNTLNGRFDQSHIHAPYLLSAEPILGQLLYTCQWLLPLHL